MHPGPPLCRNVSLGQAYIHEVASAHHIPLVLSSAVHACTSSSTSAGCSVLLFHVVSHLGFNGSCGLPLVKSCSVLLLPADCAPLLLSREKSGILEEVAMQERCEGTAERGFLLLVEGHQAAGRQARREDVDGSKWCGSEGASKARLRP